MSNLRQQTGEFLAEKKAQLPIYLDPNGRTRKAVSAAVAFRGYTTTLILDRTGTIRGTWVGYTSGREVEMDQLIEKLVHEPLPAKKPA